MAGTNTGSVSHIASSSQSWSSYWASRTVTGLAITVDSDTQFTLNWTNNGASDYTGHKIYISTDGINYTLNKTVSTIGTTTTVTGLTADTLYYVKIAPYKNTNIGNLSSADSDTTLITNPLSIATLKRWYDFTDVTSITKDGSDLISQINDKGPDGDNATAATTARPTYVASQINSKSVGRFDGVANVLTNSEVDYGTTFTLIVVVKSSSAMGCIMGQTTTNSVMCNDRTMDIRSSTPENDVHFCEMYHNETLYPYSGEEYYSFYTFKVSSRVLTYWDRKNKRSWTYSNNNLVANLKLKNIGGFTSYFFKKDIAEIITFTSALNDSNIGKLHNYLEKKYALTSFPTVDINRITFIGNSMTAMPKYHTLIYNTLNVSNNWVKSRHGQGGTTTTTLITTKPVEALYYQMRTIVPVSSNDIVVIWEGTNDIYSGVTAINAEANLHTLCDLFKDKGFKVVICTILPRTAAGSFTEAKRTDCNTLIRANYAGYAHALADVGSDALMGNEHDNENLTYYADGVHPTDDGYTRLVNQHIQAAVNSLIV